MSLDSMNGSSEGLARTISVAGITFEIDQPYKAGHVLDDAEASAFNQLREENVRNNLRKKVEEWVTEGKSQDDMQVLFDEYCESYTFGGRKGGRRIHDPILREMRNVAIEAIKPLVAKQGTTWANLAQEQKDDLLKRYFAKYETQARATAVARLEALKSNTVESLDF